MIKIKFAILVMLYMVSSGASYADYDSSDLQKLFTDKKQRAQIDAMRSGSNTATPKHTATIKVSGYMTRSDGKSVAWVNNNSTLDSSRAGGVKVYQASVGRNKKVTVSVEGKNKSLKPGEVWHKETGIIVDNQ